ncbi:MAG: VOC family protein [Planctomycetota bacterium]|nr:VOC family protein [Planctomycetota bacterium]
MLAAIDHVNLVVRDLPAMKAFYRDVLGLRVTKEVRINGPWIEAVVGLPDVDADVVYLEFPSTTAGPRIELIAYRSPAAVPMPNPDRPNAMGLRHMAFRVDAIDALVGRLGAAGVRFFGDVQQVPDAQVKYAGGLRKRLVYFRDPEDNLLELCEYRAGA